MSAILLATHGGESADGAARVASLPARRLGVPLHAVAVMQPAMLITASIRAWPASLKRPHGSGRRRKPGSTRGRLPVIRHEPSSNAPERSMLI